MQAEVTELPQSTLEFKNIVEQSKEKIHSVQPAQLKNESRGRGRPPGKYGKYKQNGESHDDKNNTQSQNQANEHQSYAAPSNPPPDISKFLIAPLKIISRLPAQKYGVAELELDNEEAAALGDSLNQLAQAFVPDLNKMSPKTAAIVNFGLVSTSIFVTKYSIYMNHNQKIILEQKQDESETTQKVEVAPITSPKMQAGEYFNTFNA